MPDMIVTLEIAGALALVNLWLGIRCGKTRVQTKVMHGDGGNPLMMRRMRAHSNFIENAPLVLILIGLIEYSLGSSWWLFALGALFVLGRLLHPLGMDKDQPNFLRGAGAMTAMLVTLILAVVALLTSWGMIG